MPCTSSTWTHIADCRSWTAAGCVLSNGDRPDRKIALFYRQARFERPLSLIAMQLADTSLHTTHSTLPFLVDERRSVHVIVMLASNRSGTRRLAKQPRIDVSGTDHHCSGSEADPSHGFTRLPVFVRHDTDSDRCGLDPFHLPFAFPCPELRLLRLKC